MNYSISDLEQLSGVSVHNIRIWERRYGALTPSRTAGNSRLYDDEQLKKLLSITGLYHAGYKISKVCGLSREDRQELLRQETAAGLPAEQHYAQVIPQLIHHTLEFNEQAINGLIADCFARQGVLATYKFVIYPLLVRIGLMWLGESMCPSQEHFLSGIIKQKLYAAIDRIPATPQPDQPAWLLFLPEDEDHDIGLLMASYLLRAAGHQVIYLGSKVPFTAITNTYGHTRPQRLLFFMSRLRPAADAQLYIDRLAAAFPATHICLSGNKKVITGLRRPANVRWLESLADFEQLIRFEEPGYEGNI